MCTHSDGLIQPKWRRIIDSGAAAAASYVSSSFLGYRSPRGQQAAVPPSPCAVCTRWLHVLYHPSLSRYLNKHFVVVFASRIQQEVPSKAVLEQEMVWMKEHLSTLGSPVVLCHNDLLCKNIIHNSKEGSRLFSCFSPLSDDLAMTRLALTLLERRQEKKKTNSVESTCPSTAAVF